MLPEKDPNKSNQEQGMYRKYNVSRVNGTSTDEDEYFVLDLKNDEFAKIALYVYMLECREEYPQLSNDLFEKYFRDDA